MFNLPNLNYGYDSLSKFVGGDTMRLHHDKHHQSYTDKLNASLDAYIDLKGRSIEDLLSNVDSLPEDVQMSVRNNGGGYYNHSFFWNCISPTGGGEPIGEVAKMITEKYGDFDKFIEEFTAKALSVFGSGWAWLQPNGDIITTANQDNPIAQGLGAPLLCLDVWEHAYYLDYKNRRDEYIKSWWNVVDWDSISKRYSMH